MAPCGSTRSPTPLARRDRSRARCNARDLHGADRRARDRGGTGDRHAGRLARLCAGRCRRAWRLPPPACLVRRSRRRCAPLGAAYGVAGLLRSVTVLAARGRCLLPLDLLARAGLVAGGGDRRAGCCPRARGAGAAGRGRPRAAAAGHGAPRCRAARLPRRCPRCWRGATWRAGPRWRRRNAASATVWR